VLQKRHLPNQPLEYLLKFRCDTKSGYLRYRERWIAAGRLLAEFAVGAALIKQFEESKVGQLAVDTYLSKRRSLPSPVLSSQDHQILDVRQKYRNIHSAGKPLKRKNCDNLDSLHNSSNGFDDVSIKRLKSTDNCVVNNSASPLHAVTGTTPSRHKLLSITGAANQPVLHHKHFAKRLLICNPVPGKDWSKNKSKDVKLPSLKQSKPVERKSAIVNCKREDVDSEDDIRYSLATDHSDESSDNEDTNLNNMKKRRKLTIIEGIKNKTSTAQTSVKAGTCNLATESIMLDCLCVVIL